jgi:CRISPR-associated protein (TIGR03986 family)
MEKAKMTIQKNNKGKLWGTLVFDGGKSMPIPTGISLDITYNDQECEVERKGGGVVRITIGRRMIYPGSGVSPASNALKNNNYNPNNNYNNTRRRNDYRNQSINNRHYQASNVTKGNEMKNQIVAKAPYNFVPLNQTVLTAELPPGQTQYFKDRHTGYLQCELVTKTPLYIRDTLDEGQIAANVESKDNPDFFGPGGKIRIPGSSLRGMIRNLVEVLSWGNFNNFDAKLLFYRGLADTSNLRKEYQQNMTTPTGNPKERAVYNFKAGYLGRDGLKYYLLPAQEVNGKTFFQVKKRNRTEEFVVEKKPDGKYLVISGKMNGKEHDWLINPPLENSCENRISIKDIDVEAYKNDDNRDERADLIKQVQKDKLVPCFYVRWLERDKSERISFGHTGYFRLAYKKSIGDHVPENLKTDNLDIPKAIFGAIGQKTAFASRVFFEDAQLVEGQEDVFEQIGYPKVLGTPKPTTFQHYLTQRPGATKDYLCHWNSESSVIRGYKFYWHRSDLNWKEEEKVNTNLQSLIKPIKPKIRFTFKIRFENLTDIELGALLTALVLPKGCCHKLGMGKALGMGSVVITTELFLSDRIQRYIRLFNNENWNLAEATFPTDEYRTKFNKYILANIKPEDREEAADIWETPRGIELQTILDWNNVNIPGWVDKTRNMVLKEFRNRSVLPEPSEYIK